MKEIFQGSNLILELKDHYKTLSDYAVEANEVLIASYGTYAGILDDGRDTTEWGYKYDNATHEFLDGLAHVESVKIVIGLPPLAYCNKDKDCRDCEIKYIGQLERLLHTAQHWPDYEWHFTEELHMKFHGMFLDDQPIGGLVGSRNLSDSTWFDVSFRLTESELTKLRIYFLGIFNQCDPINRENIEAIENKILS